MPETTVRNIGRPVLLATGCAPGSPLVSTGDGCSASDRLGVAVRNTEQSLVVSTSKSATLRSKHLHLLAPA